jgi:hypothetical protein
VYLAYRNATIGRASKQEASTTADVEDGGNDGKALESAGNATAKTTAAAAAAAAVSGDVDVKIPTKGGSTDVGKTKGVVFDIAVTPRCGDSVLMVLVLELELGFVRS